MANEDLLLNVTQSFAFAKDDLPTLQPFERKARNQRRTCRAPNEQSTRK
jgi:hypothetical protein